MDLEEGNFKSGFVSIIGRPNVGKSTLMNHIIGQKIAITSDKPQTTRNKILTVYTEERGQMIFFDTPGLHKAKNRLGEFMVESARSSIKDADVVLYIVEPDKYIGRAEEDILGILKKVKVPVILVINKADTKQKNEILPVIKAYSEKRNFADIIVTSALRSQNVNLVIDAVFKYLPYGPRYYDDETVTDEPVRLIISEIIREKALRCLNDEVPHGIAVCIDKFRELKNIVHIDASIICEKVSHKGIIIGKSGVMLKKIGSLSRIDIEELLEKKVNLKLWVKVRPKWRDKDVFIKSFGYKDEKK